MNYSVKEIIKIAVASIVCILVGITFYKLYHHQVHLEDVITVMLANDKQSAQRMLGIPATVDEKNFETLTSWAQVQKKSTDTVVQVFSETFEFNWVEPYRAPEQREGTGSGFFINSQGEFLTNYHVVSQASHISIQVPSTGQERFDAEVIGVNPDRDVALCRLTQSALEKLQTEIGVIPFLEFGDSDIVKRGHDTLALGYPLGQEHLKSTQGIISGRERVRLLNNHLCFQITAPLNPGNSGGPSLDNQGRVIGINFAGVVSAQNVGYIIPINDIKIALKDLYKIKLLRKPQLNVFLLASNEELMRYFKNPLGGGYYIAKIFKNSVLEKAGVLEGDVITEIDGLKLDYFGETVVNWSEDKVSLSDLLSRKAAGDKVTLVLYRKGQRKVISFNLEPRFSQPIRFIYPEFERECTDYEVFGGLVIMELRLNHILIMEGCQQLLKYMSPENQYESKLIITHLLPTSPGYKIRRLIGPGTVIDEINGTKVGTLDEFRQAIQNSKNPEFVTITAAENRFVVLATQSIIDSEERLGRTFFYKPSLASTILREQLKPTSKGKSFLPSLLSSEPAT